MNSELWDFIERKMVCVVPMYLRNLLAHNGFDCIDAIKQIDDNVITYLEMYAKCNDYGRKVPKDADLKDFYGLFDDAQDRFQIIRGHKILLLEIANCVSQESTKRDFVAFKNQQKIELNDHRSEQGETSLNDIHRSSNDQNKVVSSNGSFDDNATNKAGIESAIESQRSLLSSNETTSCENDESQKSGNSTSAEKKPRDRVTDYYKENECRTKQKKDDGNSLEVEDIEKNEFDSFSNSEVKLPDNLVIQTGEAEMNKFVNQLKMAVDNDMQHLLSNKLKLTSASMLSGGRTEQSINNPQKKFMWTDELRDLLCEVITAIKESYDVTKPHQKTLEDFVNQYLSEHVLKIWPEDSITIKDLEEEYEKSTVKKSKENGRIKFSIPKSKYAESLAAQSNTQRPTVDKVVPVSFLKSTDVGDSSSNIDKFKEFRKSHGSSSSSASASPESFKLFSSKKRGSFSDCSREPYAAAIKELQLKKPEGDVTEGNRERSASKESKSKKRAYDRSPKSASTKNGSSEVKRGK